MAETRNLTAAVALSIVIVMLAAYIAREVFMSENSATPRSGVLWR